jgi:tripartite ATP-independent transporter DctM subunit
MSIELLTVIMFGFMLVMLASGLPVAFVLGGSAMVFGAFVWGPASMSLVLLRASDLMRANLLVAIPLFVFMALMLERSGLAESLYKALYTWMGGLPGGLAAASVVGCTIVAAMSGISTAGVMMMGLIGYPSMIKRGYDRKMIMGPIMAGGALGPLIPPSVIMIIYGLVASISIGKLFLGGVLPGLMLSAMFIAYVLVRCALNPSLGPPLPKDERARWSEKFIALRGVILPILLVIGVLGSIFSGIATPTEAAAVGAAGSIVCAAVYRRLNLEILIQSAFMTLRVVAMVVWIIFGAMFFAAIYSGIGATKLIQTLLTEWDVSPWVVLIVMQLIWIVLGSLMEALSVLLITAPVFIPVSTALGFDPLWFGVLFVVNCEMGFLTPPFGINLFVMKGILPPSDARMPEIYRAAVPFIFIQFIGLVLVMAFPALAVWLPNLIIK